MKYEINCIHHSTHIIWTHGPAINLIDMRRATIYIVFQIMGDPDPATGYLLQTNVLTLRVFKSMTGFVIQVWTLDDYTYTLNYADLSYNVRYALAVIPRDENNYQYLLINNVEGTTMVFGYQSETTGSSPSIGPGLNARLYELIIAYTGRDHDTRDEVAATLAMLKAKWGAR